MRSNPRGAQLRSFGRWNCLYHMDRPWRISGDLVEVLRERHDRRDTFGHSTLFAGPPHENLRWRSPRPKATWTGIRDDAVQGPRWRKSDSRNGPPQSVPQRPGYRLDVTSALSRPNLHTTTLMTQKLAGLSKIDTHLLSAAHHRKLCFSPSLARRTAIRQMRHTP